MALDPTAILGPDSGSYTPDVLARRQAIAQKLYFDAAKTRPYRTWLEGVGDLANTGVYAAAMKQGNDLESGGQKAIAQALMGMGGSQQPGPLAPAPSGAPATARPITMNQTTPVQEVTENQVSPLDPIAPGVGSVPAKTQAFLNTMRGDESGGGGGQYDAMYGNRKITDFSDHPRIAFPITSGPNKGRTTTAAGADQFLASTWDQAKNALNLPDFSPNSQDKGAAWLANRDFQAKTGVPLDDAISQAQGDPNKLQQIGRMLSGTWTSLPGGIEQGANARSFGNRFSQALAPPGMPAAGAQMASVGNDVPAVPGRDTLTPQDQAIAPPGGNNPAIAAALSQQGAIGAVPPPQPDRAAIAGALNPQAPPQNVPQPPIQMAQAQGIPPQGAVPDAGSPQPGAMPPAVQQMLQSPNPYVRQRGIEFATKLQERQLAPPQFGGIGQYDAMGHEKKGWINPATGTVTPLQGGGAGSNDPNAQPPQYDENNRDEGFLKTLDPQTAAAVKGLVEGRVSAQGRNLQQLIPLAARYENGFDQSTFKTRNTFNTQLGSSSPSSVGGQKILLGTSLGHLGDLADKAADLNNSAPTGIAMLDHGINAVGNATTNNAAKVNALNETADRAAGELGKLYSGSAGGGVNEREQTRSRFGGNKSPQELAAGLEASRDLVKSKIDALDYQAQTVFGKGNKMDFLGDPGRAALAKIDDRIATLKAQGRGEKPQAQGAPAGAPKAGDVQDGYKFIGGNPADPKSWEKQ